MAAARSRLFSPRQRPGFLRRVSGWFWPRCGWRRSIVYLGHRVARVKASPHRIAAGLSCGIAIGLTPLYGLQFLLASLLAALFRGSVVVSLIGTFIANPWTIPLIWLVTFEIGDAILGGTGIAGFEQESAIDHFADVAAAFSNGDMELFGKEVWPVWFAMFVGSLPLAAAGGGVSYWPVRRLVRAYHQRRASRRAEIPQEAVIDERRSAGSLL